MGRQFIFAPKGSQKSGEQIKRQTCGVASILLQRGEEPAKPVPNYIRLR
jgi:hypothetical protein